MLAVVSRWHLVLSQNFLLARYSKAADVQGALDRSTDATMLPRLVWMVRFSLPVLGAFLGGVPPVSLILAPLVASSGVQLHATVPGGSLLALDFLSSWFSAVAIHTAAPAM